MAGRSQGSQAERDAVAAHRPARTEAQFVQAFADQTAAVRNGAEDDPAIWTALLKAWYDEVVKPKLVEAAADHRKARAALRLADTWLYQALMLSVPEDGGSLKSVFEDLMTRRDMIVKNAIAANAALCIEQGDLAAIPEVLH